MSFSNEEMQVIEWGKQNGKTVQEIKDAVFRLRTTGSPVNPSKPPVEEKEKKPFDLSFLRPTKTTEELEAERKQSLTPEAVMEAKTKEAMSIGAVPLDTDPLKFYKNNEKYFGLPLGEPAAVAKAAVGRAGQKVFQGAGQAIKEAMEGGKGAATRAVENSPVSGVKQFVTEMGERVPRFFGRMQEAARESASRAERIKTATPAAQEAIKVNLDDRIINTIEQADKEALTGYKEMIEIAEKATGRKGGTLQLAERPEIVAGKAAEKQYDLIEEYRKHVGKQIGEAVDNLSKKTKVDLEDSFVDIKDVLSQNGIRVGRSGRLDFAGSRFTPAERTRVQQLYDLAVEGGKSQSPRQIYDKDQLFSKLNREARFEGIGDIFVDTPQGKSSLFRVFRDVYTNALESASPDDIRALNKEYREIKTLLEDVESSIFRSGNYETAKNISEAEFAKTNLRRILSDAQSAPIYQAITSKMDDMARYLGYEGAKPEDLIAFSTALRDVFTETVPKTSMTGIVGSLKSALEKTLEIGAPSNVDRQRAIRALLEEALGKQ